jgi:hypothetical protein
MGPSIAGLGVVPAAELLSVPQALTSKLPPPTTMTNVMIDKKLFIAAELCIVMFISLWMRSDRVQIYLFGVFIPQPKGL